jgi:hypothetical protein
VLAEIGEGVAVFREDKELATAVGQLVELGLGEALAKSGELRVRCVIANAPSLREQILERRDLGAELIEFDCLGEFVDQPVSRCLIKIVLILLSIRETPLKLCETPRPLRGRQIL